MKGEVAVIFSLVGWIKRNDPNEILNEKLIRVGKDSIDSYKRTFLRQTDALLQADGNRRQLAAYKLLICWR